MNQQPEEDMEYLEEKFPKGKSKLRGEAMVLLALAREEAGKQKDAEVKKAIDETFKEFKPKSIFIINFCNELLTKLGLSEEGK